MKFRILNGEPLQFYNPYGDLIGTVEIDNAGELFIRANSGSRDITIGDPDTTGDVQIGTTAAPTTLKLMGGGTISANGNELVIGDSSIGDRVRFTNAIFTQSLQLTGSMRITGSVYANNFIGDGSGLTNLNGFPFTGSAQITGSLGVTGSVKNQIITLTTSTGTASMDCSLGNMFDLTLSSSYSLFLSAENIQPGQTINLRITQPATSGSLTYGTQFKFPGGIAYSASATGSTTDIVSFISYDTTTLYGSAIKNLF
jgi:hypothetical protein